MVIGRRWRSLSEGCLTLHLSQIRTWDKLLKFGKLSTYWAITSSNSLVNKLIREGSAEIKSAMEDLLRGGHLYREIDEQIIFDQLGMDENAVWSLFQASGYLKVENYTLNEDTGTDVCELTLTNKEVEIMFRKMIKKWFSGPGTGYNVFISALQADDVKSMNTYMNRIALATFSYFDSGKKPSMETQPERLAHGHAMSLITGFAFEGKKVLIKNCVGESEQNTALE